VHTLRCPVTTTALDFRLLVAATVNVRCIFDSIYTQFLSCLCNGCSRLLYSDICVITCFRTFKKKPGIFHTSLKDIRGVHTDMMYVEQRYLQKYGIDWEVTTVDSFNVSSVTYRQGDKLQAILSQ
jgi:hypothetical protein